MSDNPLKQYFRRPSIYMRLPSQGKFYSHEMLLRSPNNEYPVYPMTAIDEITLKTPDAVFNGQAIVDLIKSCIPAIKDPWQINVIDLDAILIAIKISSLGEEMDVNSQCPECKSDNKFGVNLVSLLATCHDVDYSQPLVVGDLKILFRPLTYQEINANGLKQYELQKYILELDQVEDIDEKSRLIQAAVSRLNETLLDVITSTIHSITTPEATVTEHEFIREFMSGCDRKTSNLIKEYSVSLREKNQMKPLKMKCIHCSHVFDQQVVINATDFFG